MFGKNKRKYIASKKETAEKLDITKMPDVFYGGADPEIYHTKPVKTNEVSKKDETKTLATAGHKLPISYSYSRSNSLFANKKFLLIAGILLFILAVGLISWYYIADALPDSGSKIAAPSILDNVGNNTEPIPNPEPEPVAEPEPLPTSTPSLDDKVIIDYPQVILVDDVDLDADSLTDREEELFDTDSGNWDTDDDGYYDGLEIVNLYSPKDFTPAKLVDAGIIREYMNPTYRYRLYYPLGWESASVDTVSNQVLFSSVTGDYVEVLAVPKDPTKNFVDWFAENAEGQRYTDIREFSNRFKVSGFRRQDNLVVYFVKDDVVFVLTYHPGTTGFISFRHVMIMMYQSFRLSQTDVELPEQVILPTEGESSPTN